MTLTFKKYLITERIEKQDYTQILNDANNLIGIEFEYFDDNVKYGSTSYSGGDSYEVIEDYNNFMNEVREYLSGHEKWTKNMSNLVIDTLSKLETQYKDLVKTHSKLSNKFDELEIEVDNLDSLVDELDTELDDLRSSDANEDDINKKETEFSNLTTKLENLRIELEDTEEKRDEVYDEIDSIDDDIRQFPFVPSDYRYSPSDYNDLYNIIDDLEEDFDEFIPTPSDDLMDYWGIRNSAQIEERIYNTALGDYSDFELPNGIYPPQEPDEDAASDNFEDIIENSFNFDNFPFNNYLIGDTDKKKWGIIPDGSLPVSDGGVEIVSPVMVLKDGLNAMKKVFDFIKRNGRTSTNPPTGLHINVSYKGFDTRKIDVFKMMMFMEEDFIKKHFSSREQNEMVAFIRKRLEDKSKKINISELIGKINTDSSLSIKLEQIANKIISIIMPQGQKWNAINFNEAHSRRGRIEFRYLGDEGYHNNYKIIEQNILRFYYLLKLGMDKNFKQDEYYKKVINLVYKYQQGASSDEIKDSSIKVGTYDFTSLEVQLIPKSKRGSLSTTMDRRIVIFTDRNYGVVKKMTLNQFLIFHKKYNSYMEIDKGIDFVKTKTKVKPIKILKHLLGKKVTIRGKTIPYNLTNNDTNLLTPKQNAVLFGYTLNNGKIDSVVYTVNDDFGLAIDANSLNTNRLKQSIYSTTKKSFEILRNFRHWEE